MAALVGEVSFYTHGGVAHVEMRRWASEVDVETLTREVTQRGVVRLIDANAAPVAVGLALDVDAVSIELRGTTNLLSARGISDDHLRRLRVDYFRDALSESDLLQQVLGRFAVERIGRALIHALIHEATAADLDLPSAWARVADVEDLIGTLADALTRERSIDEDGAELAPRVAEALQTLSEPGVMAEVAACVQALWASPDADWDRWASRRLAASVGAAFHVALQNICPEYDSDDLVVDLEDDLDDGVRRIAPF